MELNQPGTEEVVEIILSESKYPIAFANKLAELMEQQAFKSESEARRWLETTPICLEIYYEKNHGLFAVESESLENAPGDICSPYTKESFHDPDRLVDLGLPSGILWATENAVVNGKTFFDYEQACDAFGEKNIPTENNWQELLNNCSYSYDENRKGYLFTGPNGNTLFIPATGDFHNLTNIEKCAYYMARQETQRDNSDDKVFWDLYPDPYEGELIHAFFFDIKNTPNIGCFYISPLSVRLCKTK